MRRVLPLLAVLSLAFAPVPPYRPKLVPGTEVVVHVVGNAERIDLICGTRKVPVQPGERWHENLAARLRRLRQDNPALRRLVIRCDTDEMAPANFARLRRACFLAAYPEKPRDELLPATDPP